MEKLDAERRQVPRGDAAWRIDTITDIDTLRRDAWRWLELERECVDPNAAFQSFTWCSAWAETWCRRDGIAKLHVKLIYRGETLVALLPLMISNKEGVRILSILGYPHTQLSNALARSDHETADGIRLALAEAEFVTDADVVQLGLIVQGSALANAIAIAQLSPDPASHNSLITWPGMSSGSDYVDSLSETSRKDFRRKLRMLQEHGTVGFETIDTSSYRFGETVRLALEWKCRWLAKGRVIPAGVRMPRVDDFLTGLSPQDGTFTPEIDILSTGHDPVAFVINLTGNGRRHAWLSSYYDDYTQLSPGMLAHHMSIAAAIDAGLISYSLPGHPTPFKQSTLIETVSLLRYEKALTGRGDWWLKTWSNGLRPIAIATARQFRSLLNR